MTCIILLCGYIGWYNDKFSQAAPALPISPKSPLIITQMTKLHLLSLWLRLWYNIAAATATANLDSVYVWNIIETFTGIMMSTCC